MPGQPCCKVTMSGVIQGGEVNDVEIFAMSFNLALGGNVAFDQTLINELASTSAVNSPLTTAFHSAAAGIAKDTVLTEIKWAPQDADHKYGDLDAAIFETSTDGGYGGSVYYPSTTSYAVSLRTAIRGPKGRGRFFVPNPNGIPLTEDYAWDDTAALAAIQAWGTGLSGMLTAASDITGAAGIGLVVASMVAGNNVVTGIAIAKVPDNIRRRKNALDNAYQDATTYPVA